MTRRISSRISKRWIFSWTIVVGLALFLSTATNTEAQVTASVNGTVRDTTGAVIAGAEVLLHNNDTTLNRSTTTNDAGYYYIADVQPGNYELKVTKQGFRARSRPASTWSSIKAPATTLRCHPAQPRRALRCKLPLLAWKPRPRNWALPS